MYELNYFPDEQVISDDLKRQFRFWHVESLLNQSATLASQCLEHLQQFKQLEMLEFNLQQEIIMAEKELEIEEKKKPWDRDVLGNNDYIDYLKNRQQHDDVALRYRKTLMDWTTSPPDSDYGGNHHQREISSWSKLVEYHERCVTDKTQQYEKKNAENKKKWFADDKLLSENLLLLRKQLLLKKKEQVEKTKALDFKYQKDLVFSILNLVFKDCVDRCIIAEEGLVNIFGVQSSLKELLSKQEDMQYKAATLYSWIYEQIIYLTAYAQLDQAFTVCLSLRSLITEEEFTQIRESGEEALCTFYVPMYLFPINTHSNIRLKGIGAYFLGNAGESPWKLEIKLPGDAVYIRGDDTVGVDQSDVPGCILGRVQKVNASRQLEYAGMISLNNISPISADTENAGSLWSLKINRPYAAGEQFGQVDDIIIELNLNGKLL